MLNKIRDRIAMTAIDIALKAWPSLTVLGYISVETGHANSSEWNVLTAELGKQAA